MFFSLRITCIYPHLKKCNVYWLIYKDCKYDLLQCNNFLKKIYLCILLKVCTPGLEQFNHFPENFLPRSIAIPSPVHIRSISDTSPVHLRSISDPFQIHFRSFSDPSPIHLRSFSGPYQIHFRYFSGPSQIHLRSFSDPSPIHLRSFSGPSKISNTSPILLCSWKVESNFI